MLKYCRWRGSTYICIYQWKNKRLNICSFFFRFFFVCHIFFCFITFYYSRFLIFFLFFFLAFYLNIELMHFFCYRVTKNNQKRFIFAFESLDFQEHSKELSRTEVHKTPVTSTKSNNWEKNARAKLYKNIDITYLFTFQSPSVLTQNILLLEIISLTMHTKEWRTRRTRSIHVFIVTMTFFILAHDDIQFLFRNIVS